MKRPVRPVALAILTVCMVYPGVTFIFQGLYPFVAGEYFNLVGQSGPWMDWAAKLGIPPVVPNLLKAGVGLLWLAGVLGIWAGEARAVPLVIVAAVASLLYPGGGMLMAAIALVCVFGFRESPDVIPA